MIDAEGDHITRILKLYGDALESSDSGHVQAMSHSNIGGQQMYLRCVVLLVQLTGKYVARFLPQVYSCKTHFESTCRMFAQYNTHHGTLLHVVLHLRTTGGSQCYSASALAVLTGWHVHSLSHAS